MEVFGWLLIAGIVLISAAIGVVAGKIPDSTGNGEARKWTVTRLRRRRNVSAVLIVVAPMPFAFLSGFLYGTAEVIMLIVGLIAVLIPTWVFGYTALRLRSIARER